MDSRVEPDFSFSFKAPHSLCAKAGFFSSNRRGNISLLPLKKPLFFILSGDKGAKPLNSSFLFYYSKHLYKRQQDFSVKSWYFPKRRHFLKGYRQSSQSNSRRRAEGIAKGSGGFTWKRAPVFGGEFSIRLGQRESKQRDCCLQLYYQPPFASSSSR